MTRDDIIRMAMEADREWDLDYADKIMFEWLEEFATLVAKHEREECARMFDSEHDAYIALAIRARGGATTHNDIICMAQEAGMAIRGHYDETGSTPEELERFAALVAQHEREACAGKVGEFARKWWSIHCDSNKHMETTLKAHNDFCALQSVIRARGGNNAT